MTTSSGAAPPTARGRRRREAVLDAAAQLFHEHGFHGASIDDVGVRAGISGPGVYRHVASKDALLAAVLGRLWERLRPALDEAEAMAPREALDHLLWAHVDMVFEEPVALVLLVRDLRHLSEEHRAAAMRNHATYLAGWASRLRTLRPGLAEAEARSAAAAVHGLLDSAALSPDLLEPAPRRAQLVSLARVVIDEVCAGG